jgi:hypothetical protein
LLTNGGGGGSAFGFGLVKMGFTVFSNICKENQYSMVPWWTMLPCVHTMASLVYKMLSTFWRFAVPPSGWKWSTVKADVMLVPMTQTTQCHKPEGITLTPWGGGMTSNLISVGPVKL